MSKSEQNRPKNRASIDDSLLRLFERDERRGEKRRGEERGRRTNWPHGSIGSAACTILFGTRIETVSESWHESGSFCNRIVAAPPGFNELKRRISLRLV